MPIRNRIPQGYNIQCIPHTQPHVSWVDNEPRHLSSLIAFRIGLKLPYPHERQPFRRHKLLSAFRSVVVVVVEPEPIHAEFPFARPSQPFDILIMEPDIISIFAKLDSGYKAFRSDIIKSGGCFSSDLEVMNRRQSSSSFFNRVIRDQQRAHDRQYDGYRVAWRDATWQETSPLIAPQCYSHLGWNPIEYYLGHEPPYFFRITDFQVSSTWAVYVCWPLSR